MDLKNVPSGMWKIVYMHKPLYCSANDDHCIGEAEVMRNYFEKIFNDNKVDLIIAGHLHVYERGFPIGIGAQVDFNSISNDNNTYTNPQYPTHVVCGAAGGIEGIFDTPYPLKNFTNIAIGHFSGICEFSVDLSGNKLSMNYVNTQNGLVVDQFSIIKDNNNNNLKFLEIKK